MFDLNGLWLVGALVLTYAVGVFTAQPLLDKLKGVPSSLRSALNATESSALAKLSTARADIVKDIGKLFSESATATAAAAPAAAVAATAPAAPAAPAKTS